MPNQPIPEFPVPTGVPEQNPQLSNIAANAAQTTRDASALVAGLEEALKSIPGLTKHATREFENLSLELKADLEHMTDMKSAMESIHSFARKAKSGLFDVKSLDHASKIVDEIRSGQEKIMKLAGENTKEYKEAKRHLEGLVRWQEENEAAIRAGGKALEMNNDQMKKFSKLIEESAGRWDSFSRNLRNTNLGHMTRQVQSMSKAFAEIGIGKGFAAKMEKYSAGKEIKARLRDMKNARIAGNIAQAREKKAALQEEIMKNPAKYGLSAKDLDFGAGGAGRKAIAERMGLGKKAARAFMGGDEEAAFKHGAGGWLQKGASMLAGGAESGIGGIAGAAAEVAAPLAILELIREAFDKQAEDNKKMEASLGKAGLFTGGGTGFNKVRTALTQKNAVNRLGLNFDRNIKIAQALQEGGRGLTEVVTGKGGKVAGGEFGPGGFGQFQKIATVFGRVAGMTDVEGIQQTLKLLDQYSETLESSGDFFIKVKKGAEAAGLSTTKYIALIDEVNGHFNRMNKSLDQTMNLLGELSRTGRVGAEDLKQYMDFLTAGGPAKGMADVPLNAYAMMTENKGRRGLRTEIAKYDVEDSIKKATDAGIALTPDQLNALRTGGPGAQRVVDQLDFALAGNKGLSEDMKQSRENAINALERTTGHLGRVRAGGGAISQAFGQTFGQSAAELAMKNQDLLEQAVRVSGGTMKEYMEKGPEAFAAEHQTFTGALESFGLTPQLALQQQRGQRQAAETMLQQFGGVGHLPAGKEREQTVRSAKTFIKELIRNPKWKDKLKLSDKDIDAMSPDKLEELFQANGKELAALAPGMNATFEFVQRARMMGQDVTGVDRAAALEHARSIGFRTQTTGDLIAQAFSKWFNNLISITTKILDHISGTSDATRAQAAAAEKQPEFQKKLAATMKNLDKSQAEQLSIMEDETKSQDERDAAQAKFNQIQDQKDALQVTSQKLEDVDRKKALMSHMELVEDLYSGGKTLAQASGTDVYNALSKIGQGNQRSGKITFTPEEYEANKQTIDALIGAGKANKVGQAAPAVGLGGAPGPITSYTITVHNYSADYSHGTGGPMPGNKAGENPPNPPPSPKPKG